MYNKSMRIKRASVRRAGFTIIEVMIFLAISGLLIVGVIIGIGSSVARHRYNDSVQDFAELLRSQYSSVVNPRISERDRAVLCAATGTPPALAGYFNGNSGFTQTYFDSLFNESGDFVGIPGGDESARGRSNCSVYGLIVTLDGGTVKSQPLVGMDYTEIEKVYNPGPDDPAFADLTDIQLLSWAGIAGGNAYASARRAGCNGNEECEKNLDKNTSANQYECGIAISPPPASTRQSLNWDANMLFRSVNPDGTVSDMDGGVRTLLIFRSPKDGTVRTYTYTGSLMSSTINIPGVGEYDTDDPVFIKFNNHGNGNCQGNSLSGGVINQGNYEQIVGDLSVSNKLRDELGNIRLESIAICVNSEDIFARGGGIRMITIARDGHNSSAIELIDMDSEENICND